MRKNWKSRIRLLALTGIIGSGALLAGCTRTTETKPQETTQLEETMSSAEEETSGFSLEETETPATAAPAPQIDEKARIMENIIIGTDIHYLSPSLTDGGEIFQYMVENGDGKIVTYIDQITDAFLDEVISLRPKVLVLSGDLTLDGEKASHEDLAQKLYKVEKAGVTVLVIPGNHDINNHQAARFEGGSRLPAEYTTPEEFQEIYQDFGYKEAMSRDRGSLSYAYALDEKCWMIMLDSCQYDRVAQVGGMIKTGTYDWLKKQLESAWEQDVTVIPVAHHNLLEESEIYVEDCTIEHGEQLVELLEEWDVRLFLSGHLHVQHGMQSDQDYGIWEMVTSSLATPQCQYGNLSVYEDKSFAYHTSQLDIEQWAAKNNRKEQELLNFNKFQEPFLRRVFYNQAISELKEISELSQDEKARMAHVYAELKYYYYQGTAYTLADQIQTNPDYLLWDTYSGLTQLSDYVQYIVKDAARDYNRMP